jgi:ribulose-bisphosphate carboxylase small chain
LPSNQYIRLSAFDAGHGWESVRLSFIVNRPDEEPGYFLDRTEGEGRRMIYTTRPYATNKPAGERY